MAEVVLKDVSKVFDKDVVAVDNVNLTVQDKEFVVLVGPSGCGKSTTLRMIAGLEEITSGEIYIDGRLVNDVPPKNRDIAMVFQNYALYPHMSVYDNMAFGLKLRKFPKKDIDTRVRDAAEILGIGALLNRKPKALSGGQRQRVAVGRAIVRHPKVFLFDEPLSNLDAKFRVAMRTEISKLHARLEATMIYVTHDQTEAMTMGDRIVVMDDGIIQQVDPPVTVYEKPANRFVAGFIGSPAMNFIEGRVVSQEDSFVFDADGFSISLSDGIRERLSGFAGEEITLGVRPEWLFSGSNLDAAKDPARITAKVDLVEPMGSETYLYLSVGDATIIARVDPHVLPEIGDEITIGIDMERAHFFDTSGATIV